MKTIISTDKAPKAVGPYSQAVAANGFVFCSGQVAIDPATGTHCKSSIAQQTRMVFDNLAAVLHAAGTDFSHVVKCNVYLSSMEHFAEMNAVYREQFGADFPARLCVEVPGIFGGFDVEIDCVAAVE